MKRGFTLIELIMVIAVIGILAIAALPRFINLSTNAKESAAKGILGSIRAAIAVRYASNEFNRSASMLPLTLEAEMFQDSLIPVEPYTNSNAVTVGSGTPDTAGSGWYYDSANGHVYINHSAYTSY